MKRKHVLALFIPALLITAFALSPLLPRTLAYLTAQTDPIVNTFRPATIDLEVVLGDKRDFQDSNPLLPIRMTSWNQTVTITNVDNDTAIEGYLRVQLFPEFINAGDILPTSMVATLIETQWTLNSEYCRLIWGDFDTNNWYYDTTDNWFYYKNKVMPGATITAPLSKIYVRSMQAGYDLYNLLELQIIAEGVQTGIGPERAEWPDDIVNYYNGNPWPSQP
ncbi:MAG: hypothetical protein LBQ16_00955 [Gracilibacteraceae bacterium]|jgi:hypothetical protein|nr:hypothetical protein [Gracilibacteraceae bacterium]